MKRQWLTRVIASASLLAITAACTSTPAPQQAEAQPQETASETTPYAQDEASATPAAEADTLSSEKAQRIEVLRGMLAELEYADDTIDDGNPHAERLQDPDAIKEAIEQLKQGEDVCTRCLMACGAAS